jgi:hypothetical protein
VQFTFLNSLTTPLLSPNSQFPVLYSLFHIPKQHVSIHFCCLLSFVPALAKYRINKILFHCMLDSSWLPTLLLLSLVLLLLCWRWLVMFSTREQILSSFAQYSLYIRYGNTWFWSALPYDSVMCVEGKRIGIQHDPNPPEVYGDLQWCFLRNQKQKVQKKITRQNLKKKHFLSLELTMFVK